MENETRGWRWEIRNRNDLLCQVNKPKPSSGWAKVLYDSGQAEALFEIEDGKREGSRVEWHLNRQKTAEGKFKDGELISEKWWNSKGEEVETVEESHK